MTTSDPMPSRRPLLIFAKAPVPGKVKTRLIPALGAEGACSLYQRLLEHCLQQTADWPSERFLYVDQPAHPELRALAAEHGLPLRRQAEGDLGARMTSAMADFPGGALLIGSDCPALDSRAVNAAGKALLEHDTAIIPSEDGGYVLLNFSQLLDDEIQAVLVYGNDLPRVLELCTEVGIKGEPSLEALKIAVHV